MKPVFSHLLAAATLLAAETTYSQEKNNHNMTTTAQNETAMPVTSDNRARIREVYEQCINKRHLELLEGMVSPDFAGPQGEKGVPAFVKPIAALIKAFPDIQWEIVELVGQDDKIAVSWKWKGTHTAVFNGLAPTGKTITNEGMAIYAFRNGKIVGARVQTDRLGFLQEAGILPASPAVLYAKASPEKICLIDKFVVPAVAVKAFSERMHINRAFISHLPGFIEDAAYSYTDAEGNFVCVTVAQWAGKAAIDGAKEAVQAEYRRQGFDMPAMLKRLNITIDRGIYTPLPE